MASSTPPVRHSQIAVGPWPTDWLSITPDVDHNTVTLVIPGNPGIVNFYKQFCAELYQEFHGQSAVWAISHSCHTEQDPTANSTVDREVRHKVLFIRRFVPRGYRLRLIGHSIGCQMILKALNDLIPDRTADEPAAGTPEPLQCLLGKSYMLFPTIEKMKDTPRGQLVWPVLAYFWWVPPFIGSCVSIMPRFIKEKLVRLFLHDGSPVQLLESVMESAITNIRPDMTRNMIDLAYDELCHVTDMDVRTVKRHKDKLVFYYGSRDAWCPVEYLQELRDRVPGIIAFLCDKSIDHAFVIRHAALMACELGRIVHEMEQWEEVGAAE